MGRAIHALAIQHKFSVPVIVAASSEGATHQASELNPLMLNDVDVCIDFSVGEAVLSHLSIAIAAKKPLVIGTTNWHHQLDQVKEAMKNAPIGVIHGANFAIGTQLFYQIVRYAAQVMRCFPQYDVGGIEWHHAQKVDSPSGTARELTQIVLDETPHKQHAVFDRIQGALPANNLPFASLRSGSCPGMHTLLFDGPHDTIELRHTTRSREALAHGALMAAQWICPRKGFYTIEEMMRDMQGAVPSKIA